MKKGIVYLPWKKEERPVGEKERGRGRGREI